MSRAERIESREAEIDWLSRALASLEKDEIFCLVSEVDGKVVASSDIHTLGGYEKHVGVIGIVIMKRFRDLWIGTQMMRAQRACDTCLREDRFAQTGLIPKKHFKEGKYIDEVIMTKVLE